MATLRLSLIGILALSISTCGVGFDGYLESDGDYSEDFQPVSVEIGDATTGEAAKIDLPLSVEETKSEFERISAEMPSKEPIPNNAEGLPSYIAVKIYISSKPEKDLVDVSGIMCSLENMFSAPEVRSKRERAYKNGSLPQSGIYNTSEYINGLFIYCLITNEIYNLFLEHKVFAAFEMEREVSVAEMNESGLGQIMADDEYWDERDRELAEQAEEVSREINIRNERLLNLPNYSFRGGDPRFFGDLVRWISNAVRDLWRSTRKLFTWIAGILTDKEKTISGYFSAHLTTTHLPAISNFYRAHGVNVSASSGLLLKTANARYSSGTTNCPRVTTGRWNDLKSRLRRSAKKRYGRGWRRRYNSQLIKISNRIAGSRQPGFFCLQGLPKDRWELYFELKSNSAYMTDNGFFPMTVRIGNRDAQGLRNTRSREFRVYHSAAFKGFMQMQRAYNYARSELGITPSRPLVYYKWNHIFRGLGSGTSFAAWGTLESGALGGYLVGGPILGLYESTQLDADIFIAKGSHKDNHHYVHEYGHHVHWEAKKRFENRWDVIGGIIDYAFNPDVKDSSNKWAIFVEAFADWFSFQITEQMNYNDLSFNVSVTDQSGGALRCLIPGPNNLSYLDVNFGHPAVVVERVSRNVPNKHVMRAASAMQDLTDTNLEKGGRIPTTCWDEGVTISKRDFMRYVARSSSIGQLLDKVDANTRRSLDVPVERVRWLHGYDSDFRGDARPDAVALTTKALPKGVEFYFESARNNYFDTEYRIKDNHGVTVWGPRTVAAGRRKPFRGSMSGLAANRKYNPSKSKYYRLVSRFVNLTSSERELYSPKPTTKNLSFITLFPAPKKPTFNPYISKVEWESVGAGARYNVMRKNISNNGHWRMVKSNASSRKFTDKNTKHGKRYRYRIQSVNRLGETAAGASKSMTARPITISVAVDGVEGSGGSLTLLNNGGGVLTTSEDGDFIVEANAQPGDDFDITVDSAPVGYSCDVTNGAGTITDTPVDDISIDCVYAPTYSVGGTYDINIMTGTVTFYLNGGSPFSLSTGDGSGTFAFDDELEDGEAYTITFTGQDPSCIVITNESGVISGGNIDNVHLFYDGSCE